MDVYGVLAGAAEAAAEQLGVREAAEDGALLKENLGFVELGALDGTAVEVGEGVDEVERGEGGIDLGF